MKKFICMLVFLAVILSLTSCSASKVERTVVIEYANGLTESYMLQPGSMWSIYTGGSFSSSPSPILGFYGACDGDYVYFRIVLSPGDKVYTMEGGGTD